MSNFKKYLTLTILSIGGGTIYLVPYFKDTYYDQLLATGLSNTEIGTLVSVYGLISLFFYIPGGILADKYSPRLLYTFSMVGTGILTMWWATLPSYTELLIIFVLMSVTSVLTFWSAYLKGVRMLGTDEEQGKMFGLSDTIRAVSGLIVSFLILVVLNMKLFHESGVKGALGMMGILYIVIGILSFILLKDNKKADDEAKEEEKYNFMQVFKMKEVWIVAIFIFLIYTVYRTLMYVNPYFTQVLGVSESFTSTIAILRSYLIGGIAATTTGFLVDKKGSASRVLIVTTILYTVFAAIFIALSGQVQMAAVIIGVSVVLGGLVAGTRGIYYATMAEIKIPAQATGVATGIISIVAYSSDIFTGPLFGVWLDNNTPEVGFSYIFMFMLAFSLLSVFAIMIMRKMIVKKNNEVIKNG